MTDFVVVGGGVGGLVAARRLVLAGRSVTLLEASERLGGTVTSHTVGGIVLDAGAESFATRGGTVVALAKSLGLGDDVVEPLAEGAWLQPAEGAAFRLPENSLLGIPSWPLASDVIAAIGFRSAFRAYVESLIPAPYGAKSVTLGELVRRRMGSDVVDRLVNPIVRGVHSVDADELELDAAAPGLRKALLRVGYLAGAVADLRQTSARAGSAVAGIRGGVHRLVDNLGSDLSRFGVDVRLGVSAASVKADSVTTADGERIDGTVIVAAPGLLGGGTAPGRRVVLATLVVDEPRLDAAPRGTGVLVADGAPGIRARALTHATAKWRWLAEAAEGKHVLRLSYDADAADDVDLAEIARADASALLGVPLDPSSTVDFARVAWYRPGRERYTPNGMLVVGETIAGTGIASIVAQSEALAGSLVDDSNG